MLAAVFVSWVAVALLALTVGNLLRRVQRLEASLSASPGTPYAHLVGRSLREFVGEHVPSPCVVLFLSAGCKSCRSVLGELPRLSPAVPLAVAWTDAAPLPPPPLPPGTIVLGYGPQASAALGIRVTPFALVAGDDGRVARAAPVNSLNSISNLVDARAGAYGRAVTAMTA